MKSSGFICHDDYLKKTEKLSDAELGRVVRALMRYHATGEEVELDVKESMVFDFIRVDIDNQESAYRAKCEKNKEIRLKALEDERQRSSTNVNERDQKNIKEKNITKKDIEKDNTLTGIKEKPQKRFAPPTVDEVDAYCKERNNGINAQHFVEYYQQGNWILKNGRKMTDWKAAIRTWEGNEYHNNKPAPVKTVVGQQFPQRDYSSEDDEALQRMLAL